MKRLIVLMLVGMMLAGAVIAAEETAQVGYEKCLDDKQTKPSEMAKCLEGFKDWDKVKPDDLAQILATCNECIQKIDWSKIKIPGSVDPSTAIKILGYAGANGKLNDLGQENLKIALGKICRVSVESINILGNVGQNIRFEDLPPTLTVGDRYNYPLQGVQSIKIEGDIVSVSYSDTAILPLNLKINGQDVTCDKSAKDGCKGLNVYCKGNECKIIVANGPLKIGDLPLIASGEITYKQGEGGKIELTKINAKIAPRDCKYPSIFNMDGKKIIIPYVALPTEAEINLELTKCGTANNIPCLKINKATEGVIFFTPQPPDHLGRLVAGKGGITNGFIASDSSIVSVSQGDATYYDYTICSKNPDEKCDLSKVFPIFSGRFTVGYSNNKLSSALLNEGSTAVFGNGYTRSLKGTSYVGFEVPQGVNVDTSDGMMPSEYSQAFLAMKNKLDLRQNAVILLPTGAVGFAADGGSIEVAARIGKKDEPWRQVAINPGAYAGTFDIDTEVIGIERVDVGIGAWKPDLARKQEGGRLGSLYQSNSAEPNIGKLTFSLNQDGGISVAEDRNSNQAGTYTRVDGIKGIPPGKGDNVARVDGTVLMMPGGVVFGMGNLGSGEASAALKNKIVDYMKQNKLPDIAKTALIFAPIDPTITSQKTFEWVSAFSGCKPEDKSDACNKFNEEIGKIVADPNVYSLPIPSPVNPTRILGTGQPGEIEPGASGVPLGDIPLKLQEACNSPKTAAEWKVCREAWNKGWQELGPNVMMEYCAYVPRQGMNRNSEIQQNLCLMGINTGTIDGWYGRMTRTGVREFQQTFNALPADTRAGCNCVFGQSRLRVDGVFGDNTLCAYNCVVSSGYSGKVQNAVIVAKQANRPVATEDFQAEPKNTGAGEPAGVAASVKPAEPVTPATAPKPICPAACPRKDEVCNEATGICGPKSAAIVSPVAPVAAKTPSLPAPPTNLPKTAVQYVSGEGNTQVVGVDITKLPDNPNVKGSQTPGKVTTAKSGMQAMVAAALYGDPRGKTVQLQVITEGNKVRVDCNRFVRPAGVTDANWCNFQKTYCGKSC